MNKKVTSTVLVHQPDSAIIQCCDNTKLLLRYSTKELIGKKLSELDLYFVGKDGTRLPVEQYPVNLVKNLQRTLKDVTVGIYNEASMSLIWTRVEAQPHFDNEGNLQQITTTYTTESDISEEGSADALLFQIKDEWKNTFDAIPDVITILSTDYKIIRANKATYTIFELNDIDIISKYCYEIFHNKTSPCDHCPIEQSIPEVAPKTGLIYSPRVNKTFEVTSSPAINGDGSIKFLVHTARDITQKLKGESERTILSAAIDQTTESVVITGTNGVIEYVNPSFVRTSGYAHKEILGQDLKFLNSYDHSDSFFLEMWDILRRGEVWTGRLINRKKDGTVFEENATISPIFDNDGNIANYVAVKRDVTKEELLERQLQQAMKIKSIGTLAGGIAHDFNNILSIMISYSQVAKSRLAKDDPLLDDIEEILTAGDRATSLIKQILTFSRRDSKKTFKPILVQDIVEEVVKLLRPSLPSTIKLQINLNNTESTILADPDQIHQVIMNLCTNAKQAIGGNYGTITLELHGVEVSTPQIMSGSSLLPAGSYLELIVKDTGSGMSSETQKQIFDPFFTTKPSEEGTGLGLSVVHGIVKKHGGEISIESRINTGTTFHIFFPIITEEAQFEPHTPELDSRGTERIMVVDDEVVIARVINRMLTKLGYRVRLFTDSLEAIQDFRSHPHDIDAVITDMTMPDLTGAELAQELLALRPDLPIIMTTGYSEVIDKQKATEIGITEFMLKPIKKKRLSKALRNVLDNVRKPEK